MTSRGTKYWNSGAIPLIAPEILGNIIAEVADLAIVISEEGTVLSVLVNPMHDAFRRLEHWEGKDIRSALTVESVPKFESRLRDFLAGREGLRPVEINHADSIGRWEFPIRYSFHRIGPDGAILMLGRDLRPIAEMQQQLVRAQLALEQDHESQRENDTRFRVLMDGTRDAIVFLTARTGLITDVNNAATDLFGRSRDELIGAPLIGEFDGRTRGDLVDRLSAHAISDRSQPMRLHLRRAGQVVQVSPMLFRAGGERVLMCKIDGGVDKTHADDLGRNLQSLFHRGPDAIVFTDSAGTIMSANEGFLDLIDAAHDLNVRGRSLAEYLARGSVDLRVMTDNAARSGRMRMYPTKLAGEYGNARQVEIAVTCIEAGDANIFAMVMRDVSRLDPSRPVSTAANNDDNARSVMELVGTATLKEIVAESTSVVERMCIETAVELTMNNRVAAAEMLGLSRQSLYVKLRKYDLLSKSPGNVEDDVESDDEN
ncbi:MAG: transcriptional regulator PpsR [Limimaricola sp.]|uniref:transcriptional regulator PpsR n=1 Tax=Limimaricola sp. TaxID=2211665 RepID=UPI001E0670E2|nr:transcriptional regulator PpsR [Limimaricola sp.]MBI1417150.1 transcriptional regulator PpsR [Limimaricola sp.]